MKYRLGHMHHSLQTSAHVSAVASRAYSYSKDANGRTANIITVDIQASNGVIHVIDRVVLPRPLP
ncbi:MAG TPA: fasciclin domain-containing protein [Anaerolineales bacterium]|nr:fasciclin domain-containing protein [Anaerolineales bacterium]